MRAKLRRKHIVKIESVRLQIREYCDIDLEKYCSLLLNADVNRYLGSWVPKTSDTVKQIFIKDVLEQQNNSSRVKYIFAVELKRTMELIGNVGFELLGKKHADIGWIFHKQFWGNGYATEAATELIKYSFENKIVDRFSTSCKVENIQSEKIMRKVGFNFLKTDKDRVWYFLDSPRKKTLPDWKWESQFIPGRSD
jgi:[ribosomal protein S5]-alanine N-acetyltransferase